ncbi:unnamed protein product [Phaedon cochleariae]|uniref:Peroxidase n=1 Tax=Phaedon cochleariae TaxID=80249 RepID=A0A9N9SAH3_PHACE|nr:unnamed protein product [Phaedon cochleariae]
MELTGIFQSWTIFLVTACYLMKYTQEVDLPSKIVSSISSKYANNSEKPKLRTTEDYVMDSDQIDGAVRYGFESLENLLTVKEPIWFKMGLYLHANHPASMVANFGKPNERALELSRFGYATVEASRKIAESFPENASRQFTDFPNAIKSRMIEESCPLRGKPRCPLASKRYRTADGTCNNLSEPWKGSSLLPLVRFLPPFYEDGVQSIRRSVVGGLLPSPRQISVRIHREKNRETQGVTLMFMQWGQFIDHDVTSVVKSRSFNGSIPRCCDGGGRTFLPDELTHPSCLPIEIPEDDWFFGKFGLRCMEFLRSAPSTRIDCDLGWREQINQVTPFIDASTIYGSDVETSDSIRTFRNGKIVYGRPRPHAGGEPLRPPDPPHGELCRAGALTADCLQPGDGRLGEQPGLTALHTVWIRYHNKVAGVLSRHNPHWSDEKIFQETRKIVYALIQHITYHEFLPILLGPEVIKLFELDLVARGYYNGYDDRVDPAIANAFSSAAYRFGHSMVQNSYVRTDHKHRPILNNVTLHEEMTNFENIWSFGSLDRFLLGLCDQPAQRRDEFVCDELTNHLFQPPGMPFGIDLTAINVQRGRDHGLPPYTSWRGPCGLSAVREWRDLEKVFASGTIKRFRRVYRHVDDVDLFSGGLAEKPVRGGVVGPTFACIIAQQFLNLRKGDRFWYENGKFPSSFTPAQLQQIRKVTFSSILCQTLDEIETIQKYVFLSADEVKNDRVACDSTSMKHLDLLPWIETTFNEVDNKIDLGFGREGEDVLENIDLSPLGRSRRAQTKVKRRNRNKPSSTTMKSISSKPNAPKSKTGSKHIVIVKDANKYQKVSSSQSNNPLEVNIKIQYFLPTSSTTTPAPFRRRKRPTVPAWTTNSHLSYPVYVQSSPQVDFPGQSYGTVSNTKPSYIYTRPSFLDDYGSSGSKPDKISNRPVQDYGSNSYRPTQIFNRPVQDDYRPSSYRPSQVYSRPINVDRYRPDTSYKPNEIYTRPSSYGDNDDTVHRPRPEGYKPSNGYDQYDEVNLEGEPLIISSNKPQSYRPINQQYIYGEVESTNSNYDDEIPNYYYTQNKPSSGYDRIDIGDVGDIPKRPTFGHSSSSDKIGSPQKIYSIGHVQKVRGDHINDKLDFKTRLVSGSKHSEDNDDGFVKISSVKAQAILPSSHSFIDNVFQREGDSEIDYGEEDDSKKMMRLVDIAVAPDEINEGNWLIYNETEEAAPLFALPEFNQHDSSAEEVPQQMKVMKPKIEQ